MAAATSRLGQEGLASHRRLVLFALTEAEPILALGLPDVNRRISCKIGSEMLN